MTLKNTTISAQSHTSYTITGPDGRPAVLAVLDADGNVIDSGADVAEACLLVAQECLRNFWKAKGWLVVKTGPCSLDRAA